MSIRALTAATLRAVASAAVPALANDTSAELATGGLIFVQNDNVEMRSEDLAISVKQVDVRYRFFNKAASDVTVLVAFPMPDVRIEEQDQNISLPTEDAVNLLAFVTTVNGKPVQTQVEQHVFAAGIDRTALLRSLGIPLGPHLQATNAALDRLLREKWDELIRVGLGEIEEYDIGQGMTKHLAARWSLRTTFYWEQTFPAKAETLIEHRYRPSVGGSVQTSLGAPSSVKEAWYGEYKNIVSTTTSSPRSSACARRPKASSARPMPNSASSTSCAPAPNGPDRSGSSISPSTRARPAVSSASAVRA